MADPCAGCALVPGAKANLEPHNAVAATICALSGVPFWCTHRDGVDRYPASRMTRADFRALRTSGQLHICESWRQHVGKRAALLRQHPTLRWLGEAALEHLQEFCSADDSPDKEEARVALERCLDRILARGRA